MGENSLLKSPKKEEQLVPDSVIAEFFKTDNDNLSDFKGNLGIKEGGNQRGGVMRSTYDEFSWDHLIEWDEFSVNNEDQASGVCDQDKFEHREGNLVNLIGNIKRESCGLWEEDEDEDEEEDEKKTSLNLSLNYQEVMDAWSDRGPCRADGVTHSTSDNGYMGEVPVMEETKTKREASVLKYKKKRQNRLFSRKIRYQVRKLNADKRPRFKGRFVKRE
ncbi:hypothetical protein L1987_22174 [Smallanthus sonchifolius]|uniref:Uncharacterized protein n=1 Tax=Smallanthus sonchifolius TaxID=185202 RepID=A0ACB9IFL2_9ASTR|nr:hypothetical protein L1987_22174 [Smallanthus sonchifolius]